MQAARKYGLIFNLDKCDINIPSIKFFGCYYDAEGVHPDPAKVCDIHSLPTPIQRQRATTIPRFGPIHGTIHTAPRRPYRHLTRTSTQR